jgi:hypothetical protein
MQQFTKIIEFRQHLYQHALTRARDAQFELVDALLLSRALNSYPELSLSLAFRRAWHSAYKAIERGRQDVAWLEQYLIQQVPTDKLVILPLDATVWPHPQARVLQDRQYVYSPTPVIAHHSIVAGHPYSILAWCAAPDSSWALPVCITRILSSETDVAVGVRQVQSFCEHRGAVLRDTLHVVVVDGKYGNHKFLGPLREVACGVLVRLRRDRVLYGPPGPYQGRGRPPFHGQRFAFKEPETWGDPDETCELEDERWGQVRLRRWNQLHALQDATTVFSVLRVEVHCEREQAPEPLWLGYQHPLVATFAQPSLEDLWRAYAARWPVEPGIRFRKQSLAWTLPRFQTPEACDRWTNLVTMAQWQLWWARNLVEDTPLPWQPPQASLTPERTRQGLGALFQQIGTPVQAPQPRGKSPGWRKGRPRTRPQRYGVIRKTKKKPAPT